MKHDEFIRIDLQLFDGDNINRTTDTTATTGNDLSAENKTFYDKQLIKFAKAKLVHDQFGQKRPIPRNGGKTIEFRSFAALGKALTPLTEGTTPSGQKLNVTAITKEVSQYGGFVEYTDILDLTTIDPVVSEAVELIGDQAGLSLDTITRNVLNLGTNVKLAPVISGSPATETDPGIRRLMDRTSKLTVKLVQQIVAFLRGQNAPTINGKYVAIIHPYVAYDLMRDPEWIDAHKYANPTNLYTGEIGEVAGVRFVETTEAKVIGAEFGLKIDHAGGYTGAITSVAFDGTLEGEEVAASALVGKVISLNGVSAVITANTTSAITFASTNFGTVANDADIRIYPSLGGAVFSTLFLGANAYGVTEINGGGLQTVIKQLGSAGSADPLDQRATVGWKAIKTAEILVQQYMLRVESCSPDFADTKSN